MAITLDNRKLYNLKVGDEQISRVMLDNNQIRPEQWSLHTELEFNDPQEITDKGWTLTNTGGNGLTVAYGMLAPSNTANDSKGELRFKIPETAKKKWKVQVELIVEPSLWGSEQFIFADKGEFGTLNNRNRVGHYIHLTTSDSGGGKYKYPSGMGTGTTNLNNYSGPGGFSGEYIYEIEYHLGTYTLTRYERTTDVNKDTPYTHREVLTTKKKAGEIVISLRNGRKEDENVQCHGVKFYT